jgi:hypothetical protein
LNSGEEGIEKNEITQKLLNVVKANTLPTNKEETC